MNEELRQMRLSKGLPTVDLERAGWLARQARKGDRMGSAEGIRAHLMAPGSYPHGLDEGHGLPGQLVDDLRRVSRDVSTANDMQSLALLHGAMHNGYKVVPVLVPEDRG